MKRDVKRILIMGLILLMVCSAVFGGGGQQKQGGSSGGAYDPAKQPVAFAGILLNHPVVHIVSLGFVKAAQDLGYTNAKIIGTESVDLNEMYMAAEAFAAEGGKGLMIWAQDETAYETLASLGRQGVVVGVPHNRLIDSSGKLPAGLTFNMACSATAYGKDVAELMAKKLQGKRGTVALTQANRNVTENAAMESFINTWNSLVSQYNLSGIRVLTPDLEGGVLDQAIAVNLAIIQSHPDLLGAFGSTGNSPITWADAATKAGKKDGELVIVGMDATEGNLDYLDSGKVTAIVAQPLYEEAYKTMEYLDKVLRGGTVPAWTDLDAPIVTKDGTGPNGPAYHRDIAAEVSKFFR
jgi:ribose transport system substrate-binding protein